MANQYQVVCSVYAHTYESVDPSGKGKNKNNEILMGSFVKLLDQQQGDWEQIHAFGVTGWIEKKHLGDSPGFKCFFLDVGQGDAALIEVGSPENGLRIIIDGGPEDNLIRYMNNWQYKFYLNNNKTVHINYIFVSHFDKDHYKGLIDVINDERYTFGTIYHNGIAKFSKSEKKPLPPPYNTTLGLKKKIDGKNYLVTSFNDIQELSELNAGGALQPLHASFLHAVKQAKDQGRLQEFKRLDQNNRYEIPEKLINDIPFQIEVLGPVTETKEGNLAYAYFKNPEAKDSESHTVNGHSLVLKLKYGSRSFLFDGDLNTPAEEHLLNYYQLRGENPFEVDVAKSCHHGASEFSTEFMAKINPLATVISSGDNESYSHPRADAIGCAGKYSRSERPLVFSTELARSTNLNKSEILYGMINLRCDGEKIIMAQMKEADGAGWDLYEEELNPVPAVSSPSDTDVKL